MKVALIANGQIDAPEKLKPAILRYKRIVAVDGGLAHCQRMALQPHLITGDFDSCSQELLKHYPSVEKRFFPKDKDETDLEIAIKEEMKRGAQEIALFAAWGYRMDHSLTNALFLGRYPGKLQIETELERVFAITGRTDITCEKGQTLSLIPLFGPATGITTSGLKWELKRGKLDQNFIGVSNVCLKEKISIAIEKGILLCCLLNN